MPVEVPTIDVQTPAEGPRFDALFDAALGLDGFDDLLFTSPNAVRAFVPALQRAGRSPDAVGARVAVVGSATARVARSFGFKVSVQPVGDYTAEGLLGALLDGGVSGRLMLLPRAAVARDVLPEGLEAAGATVQVVTAYEVRPSRVGASALRAALASGIDIVTVASSNTARFLDEMADTESKAALRRLPFGSIGPITSATCVELGFRVVAEASPSTLPALVAAIVEAREGLDGMGSEI